MANLDFSATCASISGSTGSALAGRHILTAHHEITADQLLADSFASHFSLKGISIKKSSILRLIKRTLLIYLNI